MTQTIDRTYRAGKRPHTVRYVPGRFAPSSTDPRWSTPAEHTTRAEVIYRVLGTTRQGRRFAGQTVPDDPTADVDDPDSPDPIPRAFRRMRPHTTPNGQYGAMNVPATRTILGRGPRTGRKVRRVGA